VEEAGTVEPATSSPAKKSRHCADVIDLEKDKLNRKRRKELSLQELVDEDDEIAAAKLQMPFPLKKHLLDEWKLVCHESDTVKRLLKLPKAPGLTVKSVIKEFVAFKKAKLDTDNNSAKDQKSQITKYEELFVGVELYFNRALPTVLLYRQEREQYDMLVSEAVVQASAVETGGRLITPSEIYGAEHLLRFFVRLPKLLGNVFLSSTDINPILAKFAELLKFLGRAQGMQKNYDITEYVPVVEAMEYLKAHAEDLKAQPEVAEGEEDLVLCMPTTSKPNSKPKKLKKKKKNFE
jgi:mortality factor 4-like protein 1